MVEVNKKNLTSLRIFSAIGALICFLFACVLIFMTFKGGVRPTLTAIYVSYVLFMSLFSFAFLWGGFKLLGVAIKPESVSSSSLQEEKEKDYVVSKKMYIWRSAIVSLALLLLALNSFFAGEYMAAKGLLVIFFFKFIVEMLVIKYLKTHDRNNSSNNVQKDHIER